MSMDEEFNAQVRIAQALERIADSLEYFVGQQEDCRGLQVEPMQRDVEEPFRVVVAEGDVSAVE